MSGLVVLAVWVAILIGYTVVGLFGKGQGVNQGPERVPLS